MNVLVFGTCQIENLQQTHVWMCHLQKIFTLKNSEYLPSLSFGRITLRHPRFYLYLDSEFVYRYAPSLSPVTFSKLHQTTFKYADKRMVKRWIIFIEIQYKYAFEPILSYRKYENGTG